MCYQSSTEGTAPSKLAYVQRQYKSVGFASIFALRSEKYVAETKPQRCGVDSVWGKHIIFAIL